MNTKKKTALIKLKLSFLFIFTIVISNIYISEVFSHQYLTRQHCYVLGKCQIDLSQCHLPPKYKRKKSSFCAPTTKKQIQKKKILNTKGFSVENKPSIKKNESYIDHNTLEVSYDTTNSDDNSEESEQQLSPIAYTVVPRFYSGQAVPFIEHISDSTDGALDSLLYFISLSEQLTNEKNKFLETHNSLKTEVITDTKNLKPGSLLVYNGILHTDKFISKKYNLQHAAVYIDDDTIIEFSSRGVQKISFQNFKICAKNKPIHKVLFQQSFSNILVDSKRAGLELNTEEKIIERAYAYLDGSLDFGQYDALTNNCQHFALHLISDFAYSWQAYDIDLFISAFSNITASLPRKVEASSIKKLIAKGSQLLSNISSFWHKH